MATSAEFQSKLDHLPDQPGVYLFRDEQGDLLYIGKAAVLSNRVRSYFQKGTDHSPKHTVLVSHIADLETIVTRSELEALILESNLIKQHRPRFNVVLRDDKQYPYLRLPIKEDFPRLSIVRRVQQDGALYYGPYTPAGALRETLKVIKKSLPLGHLHDRDQWQGGASLYRIRDQTVHGALHRQSIERGLPPHRRDRCASFSKGATMNCWTTYALRWKLAAEREEFEEAVRLRDRLFNIERTLEKQRITQTTTTDQDVIGLARQGSAVDLQILFVRGGLLIGRKDFFWPHSADAGDEELVRSAIEQFYNKDGQPPKEAAHSHRPRRRHGHRRVALRQAWERRPRRSARAGRQTPIAPPGGRERRAPAVANHLRDEEIGRQAVEELKRLVRLDIAPRRIEGFDISNTMGNQSVASMVVWEDGQMKKSDYRRFKIQTVTGANDFASMQEVVTRRYGDSEDLARPDLILIDGGLGQLARSHGRAEDRSAIRTWRLSDWPRHAARRMNGSSCPVEKIPLCFARTLRPPISCNGFATKPIDLPSPSIASCAAKPSWPPSWIRSSASARSGAPPC